MQHLGRADAVDDVHAEMRFKALADVGWQGFSGRRHQAQCHSLGRGQGRGCQHGRKQGGRAIKRRGLLPAHAALQAVEHRIGGGPLGHQDGGGAHAQRKAQGIAKAIGKKQFRRRKTNIPRVQAQHILAVEFGGPVGVGLAVDRGLGATRGARGKQPKAGVLRVCGRAVRQG